jgi:hypothetical protein
MADDLEARIAAAVARALAERAGADPPPAAAAAAASPPATVAAGRVVTLDDVRRAAAAGAALAVPAGAIVTDLAREEAEATGVAIVRAGEAPPAAAALRRVIATGNGGLVERHERQSGSDYCTHCGGCMEPAVYNRGSRPVAASAEDLCARLDRFTELAWRSEPNEVRRLRQLSRPPMGRMPGIFYACFNLFWLGEEVQTLRDRAKAASLPLASLNELLGALCGRHAIRLSKWYLVDSIELLGDVQSFCEAGGARSHDEFRELSEHLLLAIDRVQAWIDRMIPWHTLDDRLELVP